MKIRPFLSHKRQNALTVGRLKDMLCTYGAGGWKDTDDLRIGADTPAELRRAILNDTGGFVWWGTRRALDSEMINGLEIPTALERADAQPLYPLVPVFADLSPGRDRVEIEKAIGHRTEDFLARNGIIRNGSEPAVAFRQRIARRYVRDALRSVVGETAHVAFRALSEPGGDHDLTFDWRKAIGGRSRHFDSGNLPLLIDALSNAREALQERSKSPLLRVDSDLPLPLAWLIGYEWRITTGLRLEFRQRTGSLFAWIAADGPVAEGPRVRDRIFDRNGPDVIAVSCKNSFDDHARRYAEEVSACRLVTLHRPGLLDHGEIRALARATADELRASNERNTNKHLLVLGPTSLVAMIGAASNACGPVTIPFWNGSRYVSPTTMGN